MASPELTNICSRFRRQLRAAIFQLAACRVAVWLFVATAVLVFLDWWWRFGMGTRIAVWLVLVGGTAAAVYVLLVRPLRERWSDAQVLDYLDRSGPEERRGLLVLAELAETDAIAEASSEVGRSLIASARERLAPLAGDVSVGDAFRRRTLRRWAAIAAVTAGLWAAALVLTLPHSLTGLTRLVLPFADVRWPQETEILLIRPSGPMPEGGWPTPIGDRFALEVRVAGRVIPHQIELAYRGEHGGKWVEENLPVGKDHRCTYVFPEVSESVEFYLRGNDARTDRLRIRAVERPALTRIVAVYQFPLYSRVPPKRVESGAVSGLEGTRVLLTFTANQELASAALVFRLGRPGTKAAEPRVVPMKLDPSRKTFRHLLTLKSSGSYEVRLKGATGLEQGEPEIYPIQVHPDQPPTAAILEPTEDLVTTPRGQCTVALRATDDFRLEQVELRYRINEGPPRVLSSRITGPIPQKRTKSEVRFTWDFRSLGAKPGDQMVFYVWARDCNPSGRGVAESARVRVSFKSPTEFQTYAVLQAKAMLTEAKTAYEQQKYAAIDFRHWLAGTQPDPKKPLEPRELLSRARAEQDYALRAAEAVAFHMRRLRAHVEANDMRREFMNRRLDQIEQLLQPVRTSVLPGIERDLAAGEPANAREAAPAAALAKMRKAVRSVQPRQRRAALALYRVYTCVADWADLQNVLVKTKRLAEDQAEVHATTVAITPRFKGKEIEDLDEKTVEELTVIGQQQHALYEAERALEAELARLIVKSERERRMDIYRSLMTAFKGLKTHLVNDSMRRAAMAIADNRPHTILDVQKFAIKGLRWVRDGLIRAGERIQSKKTYPPEEVALILEDDRLKPVVEERPSGPGEEVTPPVVPEPEDVKPAQTLEYALQVWQEHQSRLHERTQHIWRMLGRKPRSPRYVRLKMGMLALRSRELESAMTLAERRAAGHECQRVGPRVTALAAESRKAIQLTRSGRVGPGVQRIQSGVAEGVKDLRSFLQARSEMLTLREDHKASKWLDAARRPYVLALDNLDRALAMCESLSWALLLERDAARKAAPVPKKLSPEDRALCRAAVRDARRLLGEMAREVRNTADMAKQFTNDDVHRRVAALPKEEQAMLTVPDVRARVAGWAGKHLASIRAPEVPENPDAAFRKTLNRLEWTIRQAIDSLKDLADARLHKEIPIPEEERLPTAPEIANVDPSKLANAEVLETVRAELLKYDTPEAIIRRIEASKLIPDAYKPALIEATRKPHVPKYRALVNAYLNAISRYGRK